MPTLHETRSSCPSTKRGACLLPTMVDILIPRTHNSARSVLTEAMDNQRAMRFGRDVHAFRAGSKPSGRINPHTLYAPRAAGIDVSPLRSNSWDEFVRERAPCMRAVVTESSRLRADATDPSVLTALQYLSSILTE
jgi:protein-tyrosine-phosphatase